MMMKTEQNKNTQEFTVTEQEALERLDRFLSQKLEGLLSREKIKKNIQEGLVFIEGEACRSPKRNVLAGEHIVFKLPETVQSSQSPQPEEGELEIIFADEYLAVIKKPAGLSVHPSPGEENGTLVNRLLYHFPLLKNFAGERPGIVHRLDKDTTGIMLVALNEDAAASLMESFAQREIGKEYLALVYGVPQPSSGRIEAPIGRDPRNKTRMAAYDARRADPESGAREARSDYRTLYADPTGRFSLLAVQIHSGRTHQIRVHLTHIGHPIIGDKIYADEAAVKKALSPKALSPALKEQLRTLPEHQLLHAWQLNFAHPALPAEGQLQFCAEPPKDFARVAQRLSERLIRVVLTGNPACGKSSVLKILTAKNIPVWSADAAVAAQYRAGADGWQLIKAQYGNQFMLPEKNGLAGDIDKHALFKLMYDDDKLRGSIERIIHPVVLSEMLSFWNNLDTLPLHTQIAVAEVPLYFESLKNTAQTEPYPPGFAPARPFTIGIHCPFATRAARMRETRQWADSMIEKMESWQLNEDKKMAACDLVINNTGSPEQLADSVNKALNRLADLQTKRLQDIATAIDKLTACIK